jgi:hypothetical protein
VIDVQRMRSAPALSIRQPWAELILRGEKDVEVRTWTNSYRGPIWLHTGTKVDEIAAKRFRADVYFTGGLVGFAELTEICAFTPDLYEEWRERHLDFSSFPSSTDIYAWILCDAKRLEPPRKCKGALGLFQVDTSAISDGELEHLVGGRDGVPPPFPSD